MLKEFKTFLIIFSILSSIYVILSIIQKSLFIKNTKRTFNRLNKLFKNDIDIYNKLKIYEVSIPRLKINFKKRKRCVLLIGGYRDIPNVWIYLYKYLDNMKIDYYAPRTTGNGRMFFQRHIRWQDWLLTYFEAIIFLSSIYKKIDIIGFSTGCNVAIHLSSIYWNDIVNFDSNCKINNLILLSPNFLSNSKHLTYKKCMKSKIFYKLLTFLYPISLKPIPDKKIKCDIDIEYKKDLDKIYYERSILIESLKEVWEFCDIIPESININKIYMIYGDKDNIVGNFKKQKKILENIHNKKTDDRIGNVNCFKLINAKHNILNEHPLIRYTLFSKIKELLYKN